MPRPKVSDMPLRQSSRAPGHQRTSSPDSDPLHRRPIMNRIPKAADRRSPRGSQSDPLSQKKLGTRISDLENQLAQAQEELKSLKQQLASAEAAKKEAHGQLHTKNLKQPAPQKSEIQDSNARGEDEVPEHPHPETDVFEVIHPSADDEKEAKSVDPENQPFEKLSLKNDEVIIQLKALLEEKEKEMSLISHENESLKKQAEEAALEMGSKREEMSSMLAKLEYELKSSKENGFELSGKLEAVEEAKEALEAEMRKLRVQTEQWRKAADAAAAVLAAGSDMNNVRNVSDQYGSMDKQFNGIFNVGSSEAADEVLDDGVGGGKRKAAGIKMFGDLWKKKGQK
ncbi:hypothetical protein Nepgr_027457 [Nepenthes gracilis]|uniref:Interactor of constitutive active ROPs 4 n=1 Tax=Nepenthes gracilis TaxID=150966 RepID=A0AAD3TAD6_NEPGR|nr:hypothetical protein Nepgr_027457 [Nepenthes gracilis]